MLTLKRGVASWFGIAAGGVGLLAVVGFAQGERHSSSRADQRKVAENLDNIIQARFLKIEGMFGLSRMTGPIGHTSIFWGSINPAIEKFHAANPVEERLLLRANASGDGYIIAFLHFAHPAGHFGNNGFVNSPSDYKPWLTPLFTQGIELKLSRDNHPVLDESTREDMQAAAVAELPHLLKGKAEEKRRGDLLLVMRPVRATQPSCVSCHSGSHSGEALGAMVYAVQ